MNNDELTLAYMSIETMRVRIDNLEVENAAMRKEIATLRKRDSEPHGASPGWSGDDTEGYHQGFNGHGY